MAFAADTSMLFTEGDPIGDTRACDGPIEKRWDERRFHSPIVSPANRQKRSVIVVGTGLAGGSAAATLGEAGYQVTTFCYQDSPRRAYSVAAQGGINATKNYRNDGDSVHRLFYDTVKGSDYRSRESNVHLFAQVSVEIIDQCVAQGVPFARDYGGVLDTRSFGGVQVSRTFYARGQTGQQLLLGAYQALERQIAAGTVTMHTRHEMLELIVSGGRAHGIVVRDMVTGEIKAHLADAVVLATGGYGNVFYLSTNAKGCNVTATWRAHRKGALFANPCYTQIHPTCIPVSGDHQSKLTLMSESLRNDGRVCAEGQRRHPVPGPDPRGRAQLLPGAHLPVLRQPGPARHRVPRSQERLRRGPGPWPRRARRLLGLRRLRDEFWQRVKVTGTDEELNQVLEKAGRVADFLELAELMCIDALHREESCAGHFRAEYQTEDGEVLRDDEHFAYVGAWEFTGTGQPPVLHKEPLAYEYVHMTQRSYK